MLSFNKLVMFFIGLVILLFTMNSFLMASNNINLNIASNTQISRTVSPNSTISNNFEDEFGDTDSNFNTNNSSSKIKKTLYDPLEAINRVNFNTTQFIDKYLFAYVSDLYRLIPDPIRLSISNILNNLNEPFVFINDMLQFRVKSAGISALRFVVNSTVGIVGIFDIMATYNYYQEKNDLSYTLAYYNIKPFAYVFLPVLGPQTLTSVMIKSFFIVSDLPSDSIYHNSYRKYIFTKSVGGFLTYLNNRNQYQKYISKSKKNDLYLLLKSSYYQQRLFNLKRLHSTW